MWTAIAVGIGSSLIKGLINKPEPRRIEATRPEVPRSEYGAPISTVFNQGKVAGNLFYSTLPFKTEEEVPGGKGGRPKEVREDYQVDLMGYILSAVEPVEIDTLFLNGEVVYQPNSFDINVAAKSQEFATNHLTIFDGEFNQVPSTQIEAIEGVGNVPAFNGISYILLRDLALSRYGSSYPQVHAILKSKTQYNLGTYLRRIIELSGINVESQADFGLDILTVNSAIDDIVFQGFTFDNGSGSWLSAINPIMEFYQLVVKDNNGTYEIDYPFTPKGTTADVVRVDFEQVLGVDGDTRFTINDFGKEIVPNLLNLTFPDPDLEFDNNSTTAISNQGDYFNETDVSFHFAMSRQRAASGAERLLRASQSRKRSIEIKVPITFEADFSLGKLLEITNNDLLNGTYWLITEINYGNRFFMEIIAEQLNPAIYAYARNVADSERETVVPPTATTQASLEANTYDINWVSSSDTFRFGGYIGYSLSALTAPVYYYISTDDINYTFLGALTSPTVVAVAQGTLPASSHFVPDEINTLTVTLVNPNQALYSVSQDDFLAGAQLVAYGKEIISYRDATLISPGVYELSGLLRGYRFTESFIGTQTANEVVAFFKGQDTARPRIDLSAYAPGQTLYFKFSVSSSGDLSGIPAQTVIYDANSAKVPAPVRLPSRLVGTDIVIDWVGRSVNDNNYDVTDNTPIEVPVDGYSYELIIRDPDTLVILRTVFLTTAAQSYTYTAAEQAADGFAKSHVTYDVFGLNSRGRGYLSVDP